MRALYEQGLKESLEEGKTRHEFKAAHGFRKYIKTRAEQVMNRLNAEYLLGHSIGLSSNYYRPTESELLQDYLKAVDSLTISESKDIANLKEQQEVLEKKQEDKDKELEQMRQQQQQTAEQLPSVTAKLEQMLQKMMEIYGLLPNMRPDEANKLAAKLFKGLPLQRAAEEREKKKRRLDDILYGD